MKTLKEKQMISDNWTNSKNLGDGTKYFREYDVKKAILDSYNNNEFWIRQIEKVLDKINLTEYEDYELNTALDGLKNHNKNEVFGDFEK